MADSNEVTDQRRREATTDTAPPASRARWSGAAADAGEEHQANNKRRDPEQHPAPAVARVRDEDLEPHEGLRYIAKLFKALALLLIFMLIAEIILGLQRDGTAALGGLLVEATRLIVFAGFLWGIGDIAVMLIESNHDLRAVRILLGRLNGKTERLIEMQTRTEETPRTTTSPPPPGLP